MTREERKRRRAGRLRFWIMLAACLIKTVAAASTMVQAAAGAPSLRQRNICGNRSETRSARLWQIFYKSGKMETIEIQRKELNGAKPLCYGYKAVKWDSERSRGFDMRTGEKLEVKYSV